jgi:hypothetical protein
VGKRRRHDLLAAIAGQAPVAAKKAIELRDVVQGKPRGPRLGGNARGLGNPSLDEAIQPTEDYGILAPKLPLLRQHSAQLVSGGIYHST